MPTLNAPLPAAPTGVPIPEPPSGGSTAEFVRRGSAFVAVGILLYLALYAFSESLVHRYALRNRFYMVQTAPHQRFDYVILGASHAAVLDYRDMNARLEEATGSRVLNLSTVGGGVVVNRFLLDYFFSRRDADAVAYVLDSFAFYSPEWNEERLADVELYRRALADPGLAARLIGIPPARAAGIGYASGFIKINNPNRFAPDVAENEGSAFDRTYRPIAQLDRQRIAYLYPEGSGGAALDASVYLSEFEDLIRSVQARGSRFVIIRPPIPERFRAMLPGEDEFDARIERLAADHGVELYDFSRINNDPALFHDSDHLNRAGVERFIDEHLRHVLRPADAAESVRTSVPADHPCGSTALVIHALHQMSRSISAPAASRWTANALCSGERLAGL